MSNSPDPHQPITGDQARELLSSVPPKPRREFRTADHLVVLLTAACSLASGVLALSGHGWVAIAPALAACLLAQHWFASRQSRVNEPRYWGGRNLVIFFMVWLSVPIWRNLRHQETAPLPDALILAGLAPALWLAYYLYLLIKR